MKLSMSSAMLLKVSASSLISAAPLHGSALVEFAAADGARGSGQRADRRADADGEQIAENQRGEGDDQHERERLGVQFADAGIVARLVQAALRDHGPVPGPEWCCRCRSFRRCARFRRW